MVLAALAERVCHSAWVCGALISACAFLFRQCNVGAFFYSRCKPDGLRLLFCPLNFCGIGQLSATIMAMPFSRVRQCAAYFCRGHLESGTPLGLSNEFLLH